MTEFSVEGWDDLDSKDYPSRFLYYNRATNESQVSVPSITSTAILNVQFIILNAKFIICNADLIVINAVLQEWLMSDRLLVAVGTTNCRRCRG